jgi:molybdenum cofactor biosynthesis enzyme MoaA
MKIQTFSILAGSPACNANCPFCVSKMTPENGSKEMDSINYDNFHNACKFALSCGVNTTIITGKGEPTLRPDHISTTLCMMKKSNFPFIELQTNGINLADEDFKSHLQDWKKNGLTTISLSCVHYEDKRNKEIYGDKYPSLSEMIPYLQGLGYSVRLSCIMVKDYIDSVVSLHNFVDNAKNNIEKQVQLTFRPVTVTSLSGGDSNHKFKCINAKKWTTENQVSKKNLEDIHNYLKITSTITPLLSLVHGATVYDYNGQNVCMTNCLTRSTDENEIRQLIYFPDGRLRYDWELKGAILL